MTVPILDTVSLKGNFNSLIVASRESSLLYHALLIRPGHHAPSTYRQYSEELYSLTSAVIDSYYSSTHNSVVMPPHLQAFLLQLHLEGKSFYALLRNLVTIASTGWVRKFHWDPWTVENKEITHNGQLSTSRITKNISDDLRRNHPLLADQFDSCFGKQVTTIRNAVAHAMFIRPSPSTGDNWKFGAFDFDKGGGPVGIKEVQMSVDDVNNVVTNLLQFKQVVYECCEAERQHLLAMEHTGQYQNQMAVDERIDFTMTREHLSIRMPPTPFVPGLRYAS